MQAEARTSLYHVLFRNVTYELKNPGTIREPTCGRCIIPGKIECPSCFDKYECGLRPHCFRCKETIQCRFCKREKAEQDETCRLNTILENSGVILY